MKKKMSKITALLMSATVLFNVNVLAEKVGYQYASYFCRQFKKYTGMTVGEYKRKK